MPKPETFEIDAVELVDSLIRDCLAAHIPPYPSDIAENLCCVLSKGQLPADRAMFFAELLGIVRWRVELAAVAGGTVN